MAPKGFAYPVNRPLKALKINDLTDDGQTLLMEGLQVRFLTLKMTVEVCCPHASITGKSDEEQ